jgi:hypothetical protein
MAVWYSVSLSSINSTSAFAASDSFCNNQTTKFRKWHVRHMVVDRFRLKWNIIKQGLIGCAPTVVQQSRVRIRHLPKPQTTPNCQSLVGWRFGIALCSAPRSNSPIFRRVAFISTFLNHDWSRVFRKFLIHQFRAKSVFRPESCFSIILTKVKI